jgi:hypothetical protein
MARTVGQIKAVETKSLDLLPIVSIASRFTWRALSEREKMCVEMKLKVNLHATPIKFRILKFLCRKKALKMSEK